MTARRISILIAALLALAGLLWLANWTIPRPIGTAGGLFFPGKVLIDVPQYFQADARWAQDLIGASPSTLGAEGCAVSAAAMTLASYGIDTDPGRLNHFLAALPGGYTPQGWIYWEKAAEIDPRFTARLLPHYEDKPSYFLIDWNLLHHNPVIARVRYPSGMTHFVVICGKQGLDYLIRDSSTGGRKGVYPFRELSDRIEAIRYYRKP